MILCSNKEKALEINTEDLYKQIFKKHKSILDWVQAVRLHMYENCKKESEVDQTTESKDTKVLQEELNHYKNLVS